MPTKTQAPKRAAIYCRISDDRDELMAGVSRQADDCIDLCQREGWQVHDVFSDNNVSATSKPIDKRAEGLRLLQAVKAGDVDVVVTWSAERLYRRPADLDILVQALGNIPVVTVRSGTVDLSTADGRMIAGLLGTMARHEVEKRGERVARAAAQRAKEGRYHGGKRSLGYSADASELVPAEAEQIAWAYRHVADGGSLESVVRQWRSTIGQGALGGKITGVQVRDTLLKPLNAGLAVHRGEVVGRTSLPVIVDEDTWRTVRAILMDPARRTTVGRPAITLLAPVLRCATCQGRMSGQQRRRRQGAEKYAIYACREGHVSKHRQRLDDAVGRLVVKYLERHASKLVRPKPQKSGKALDQAAVDADAHRKRLEDLALLLANGDLAPADYATATREVRARLAAAEERIVIATGKPHALALVRTGDIEASWKTASVDAKRAVVKELVQRINVGACRPGPFTMDGVEIEWKE